MKQFFILATVSTLLGGCASAPGVKFRDVSYPSLNVATTAYLGDHLLKQGRGFETDVLELGAIDGKFAHIKAGTYCRFEANSTEFSSFDREAII